MKKLLLAFMAFLSIGMSAQIYLGGNSTTSGALPVDTYYGYTYSQQIFTKSEINASSSGNITGLKFYLPASASVDNTNNWTVYIGHTAKTTFTSTTDWVNPVTGGLTQVFSGIVTNASGEVTVNFPASFLYNNVDNLIVVVDENAPNYDSSTNKFYSYTGVSNSTLSYTSDSTNPDPTTFATAGSRSSSKSRMAILGLIPNAPSCPTLSAPTANATGVSLTPTISWAAAAVAASYEISIGTTPGGTNVLNSLNVGNVTTYAVLASAGLQYGTPYYLTVKAVNAGGVSTGCTERMFTTTTTITCPTVSALTAGATGVSLNPTITWAAVNGVSGYRLSVGTTSGGTDIMNSVDLGNVTSYTLPNALQYYTTYYYRLIPYAGTLSNTTCTVRNFTTLCAALIPPYSNNFSTFPGSCWSRFTGGTALAPGTTTGSYWTSDTFANVSSASPSGSFNIYSSGRSGHLVSPTFDMSAGGYRVKFNYAFTMYNSQAAVSAMGSDDKVQVVMSTDGGTTWVSIDEWNSSTTSLPNTSTEYLKELPAVTSNNVKFALFATSGTVDNSLDYEFHIDDFVVEPIPACAEPSAVSFSNIAVDGAQVSWSAPSLQPANGYVVYYSTVNTAPTSATVLDATNSVSSTTTSATISGLLANTVYYVWVKSVCSTVLSSTWVSGGSFTTLCTALNIPYTENFNGVTAPALPQCTANQNVGTGNNWVTYGSAGGTFTGNVLNYSYSSANPANTWFYTAGLNLTAGTMYRLSYKYGNASGTSYPEKLKVAYGTAQNNTTMNTQLADHPNVVNGNTAIATYVDFTVPTSGVYYFGFNAYSATNMNRLYVDDISVVLAPTCFAPTALTVGSVTSSEATISWTAPTVGTPQSYEIYYSTTNTPPTASTVPQITGVTGTSHTIPGLNPSTKYYVWVRTSCSATDQSEWSTETQFDTVCQPPSTPTVTGETVCPNNTATLSAASSTTGATITWYNAATAGTVLSTGNTYTTAPLATTTSYWVSASNIATASGGKATPVSTDGNTGYSDIGLVFDATTAFKLKTVEVYPRGTVGNVVNATVQVKSSTGTVLHTKTIAVTIPAQTTPMVPVTLSLDFDIVPGSNYRLVLNGITPTTGLTSIIRESNTNNFTYPYALGSAGSIKSAYTSGASTDYYYYFYNWQIETGCESPRQEVVATVSSAGCLGTSELAVKHNVKVYPNPFKEVINIVGYENYVSGMVMDASGKVVKVLDKIESTVNLSGLTSGMYILNMTNKTGDKVSVKIIKN